MPPPQANFFSTTDKSGYDPATLSDDEEDYGSDASHSTWASSSDATILGFADGFLGQGGRELSDWRVSRIGGLPVRRSFCFRLYYRVQTMFKPIIFSSPFSSALVFPSRSSSFTSFDFDLSSMFEPNAAPHSNLLSTRIIVPRTSRLRLRMSPNQLSKEGWKYTSVQSEPNVERITRGES